MERVKVFLRVKGAKTESEMSFTENSVLDQTGIYEFDQIFEGQNQKEIYNAISPMVKHTQNGYNLTVFAYGQTGSGKTYTIEGTEKMPGVIPRVIEEIFDSSPKKVLITALEIYNEKVSDLLSDNRSVCVREDKARVTLDPLRQEECKTKEEALRVFLTGSKNRKTEDNGINITSSRSHMIFTIQVERATEEDLLVSKITLVDLAGSEKLDIEHRESHAVKKHRPEKTLESANINKSLLYLSRIIYTLSSASLSPDPAKTRHINYRDSKLTFILRDSLNGKSHLAIIGTVNIENKTETKNTIKFLSTAKQIKLTPESLTDHKTTSKLISQIKHLTHENYKLLEELSLLKEKEKNARAGGTQSVLAKVDSTLADLEDLIKKTENLQKKTEKSASLFGEIKENVNLLHRSLFSSLCKEREESIENIDPVRH